MFDRISDRYDIYVLLAMSQNLKQYTKKSNVYDDLVINILKSK